MVKRDEKIKLAKMTITIASRADALMRRQAFNEKITLGELVEKYREAWLREKEREKAEKEKKEN
jgi:hypothetical protein